ncbi:MAG TPA: glycosyltransferase family 4 protein [Bryobacteraceae bacterium]|nr:glycosyltransferase family 4 protein [Bryobacteraceae bacterium]
MKKQVLLVCPESPYPVLGGGAQRIASLVEYFAARGCDVDILTFIPCQAPPSLVREILCVPLPANGRSLPARVLRNAGRLVRGVPPLIDRLSGFDAGIRAVLGARRYDLAVLEHFWVAPYVQLMREFAARLWCDLHNIESQFFYSVAASSGPLLNWAHGRFGRLSEKLESDLLPRFDGCLVCSERDAALLPALPAVVYPNTIGWFPPSTVEKAPVIVFSGNMEYHPNQQGVRWFFTNVWPSVRKQFPELRWRLVGMNPDAVRAIVSSDPAVELTGAVPDAMAEIARAQLSVVPLLSGSGTRIKILEAWAAGTAVVSTAIGAEGLPPALQIADGPEAFTQAVLALLRDARGRDRLAAAGREVYEERFHRQAGWSVLDTHGPGRDLFPDLARDR